MTANLIEVDDLTHGGMMPRKSECHPDRPMLARGLCRPCYSRLWKAEGPFPRERRSNRRYPPLPWREFLTKCRIEGCNEPRFIWPGGQRTSWCKGHGEEQRFIRQHVTFTDKYRDRYLINRYGITSDEYTAMGDAIDWICPLCLAQSRSWYPNPGRARDFLMVDHDPFTGKIRGLLCNDCNQKLHRGLQSDWIDRALNYLKATV